MDSDMLWTAVGGAAALLAVYTGFFALVWTKPVWSPPAGLRRVASRIRLPAYEGLPESVMVTGGCGFLGRHIVEALAASGVSFIVVFDLAPRDVSHVAWIADLNKATPGTKVEFVAGDLKDPESVRAALKGVKAVVHCASPHPQLASDAVLEAVIVDGTRELLTVCADEGVKSFVLTSSASVVFSGTDQPGADETVPIPSTFRDFYSVCKAQAEKIVCAAGSSPSARVLTAAVRPHGIFGPRDTQAVPGICEVSSTWRGKLVLGDGNNMVDFTYVGNVVHGHILALQRLHAEATSGKPGGKDGSRISGKAFFVTNDEPLPFWSFVARVKAAMRYPAASVRIPYRLAHGIATLQEAVAGIVASMRGTKPTPLHLSPQRVAIAGTAHWYKCDRAKAALGYSPVWNMDQALALTAMSYPSLVYSGPGAVRSPIEQVDEECRPCDLPQMAFSRAEVAQHNTDGDAWLIVDGKVHDVTYFVDTHPGGPDAVLRNAGKDASEGFHGDQHPENVVETLADLRIGWVEDEDKSG
ncbi:hypothetical protein FNF27_02734 [Cafeteria roenbergensis]|uniref:Cytochrome b5 heme-binding domain-containing protein n=2 Tax=Cafeteria roenbergensis TaxID=33653 RepID=A0A5A8EDR9_CAFRO|nr:hypothetical protein FNF27_02734 [Cafeteria roenbergensis]